jgi:hypothetical protein
MFVGGYGRRCRRLLPNDERAASRSTEGSIFLQVPEAARLRRIDARPPSYPRGAMPKRDAHEHSLPTQLRALPAAVRAIVQAARRTVKAAAPAAIEVGCQMAQPRSKSMMWKLCRYGRGGEDGYVVAIGAFANHASIFFARGAELEDGSGILEGSGKQLRYVTLRTAADAERAIVKRVVRKAFRVGTGKPSRATDVAPPSGYRSQATRGRVR